MTGAKNPFVMTGVGCEGWVKRRSMSVLFQIVGLACIARPVANAMSVIHIMHLTLWLFFYQYYFSDQYVKGIYSRGAYPFLLILGLCHK